MTEKIWTYETLAQVDRATLENILRTGVGHPQGGNIISGKKDIGVVNPEFRVHGYKNLFLCDASVFPTSVGVNPQISVMTFADYAVKCVK